MKKHSVDDLFARKLSTWEPTPSDAVWQRIQAGQTKKERRLAGWYWYAAASVALVLVAGYVVWKGQSATTSGLADGAIVRVEVPGRQVPATPVQPPTGQVLPKAEKPTVPTFEKEPVPVYQPAEAVASRSRVVTDEPAPAATREPEPVLDLEVAKIAREEVPAASIDSHTSDLKVPAGQSIAVVPPALREKTENRVVIAHVDVEEEENEDQKSSRLVRILRQLKNAKEGEAVNWNEVGVNPRKLMARADERIKTEEEKVSRQYNNLKEKIQL